VKDPRFDEIVVALQLQSRGTGGEHTAAVDDVYDISNRARLKKSEVTINVIIITTITIIITIIIISLSVSRAFSILPVFWVM